jgi:hypothetical protein
MHFFQLFQFQLQRYYTCSKGHRIQSRDLCKPFFFNICSLSVKFLSNWQVVSIVPAGSIGQSTSRSQPWSWLVAIVCECKIIIGLRSVGRYVSNWYIYWDSTTAFIHPRLGIHREKRRLLADLHRSESWITISVDPISHPHSEIRFYSSNYNNGAPFDCEFVRRSPRQLRFMRVLKLARPILRRLTTVIMWLFDSISQSQTHWHFLRWCLPWCWSLVYQRNWDVSR